MSRMSALGCDLNRWMQHLSSNYRAEGVASHATLGKDHVEEKRRVSIRRGQERQVTLKAFL